MGTILGFLIITNNAIRYVKSVSIIYTLKANSIRGIGEHKSQAKEKR